MKRLPSLGELKIRTWLYINNIPFEMEKEFIDLVNSSTHANLRFDFYLPNEKMAIEFDGYHHMSKDSRYHGGCQQKFKQQKKRDNIKNNWCRKKGVTMLRISCMHSSWIYKILFDNLGRSSKSIEELYPNNMSLVKESLTVINSNMTASMFNLDNRLEQIV
mgnify:CR=1 FL=1